MKTIRPAILVLCGLLARLPTGHAADGPPPPEHYLAASGAQLARELVPAATRLAAVQELARRANASRKEGESLIVVDNNAEPETVVCPQVDGKDPLYIVLYKFLPDLSASRETDGYPVARPAELFPPEPPVPAPANAPVAPPRPPLERRSELVIVAFNARGEEVKPFGGDNMLEDGVLADFTGDGRIERADNTNFGVDGVKNVQVLVVSAVETPTARPLLAVLYNWGEQATWNYEFASRPEDGTVEVRLGPAVDDEGKRIDPKVTYRWDAARKEFVGPAGGGDGEHFLVLDERKDLFDTVAALKDRLPFFVGGNFSRAESVLREIISPPDPPAPFAPPAPRKPSDHPPVPAAFLDGLADDAAILRFFDDGRNPSTEASEAMRRRATSIALPPDFWTGPPKSVALALAELNRTPAHRERYRLVVDDREGVAPPAEGAVLFSTGSSRCYRAADGANFLRFGSGDAPAYLIHLGIVEAGAAFYNVVGSQPAYDLRWCEMSAADARQFAAVLWWLDRVRSRSRLRQSNDGLDMVSSTADGSATFQLLPTPAGPPALRLSGILWSGLGENDPNPVSARWKANYAPETALNIAFHLAGEVLPDRLGKEWSRFEPSEEPGIGSVAANHAPRYAPDESARLHDLALRALTTPPQGQTRISYPLLLGIVMMIGDLGFDDLAPALRKLALELPLPAPGRAGRTAATIQREMDAVDPYRSGHDPLTDETPEGKDAHKRWDALFDEWLAILNGTDEPGAAENLRGTIQAVLDCLAKLHDPAALAASAADSHADGAQWALQQLRRLKEDARATVVLEGWLKQADNPGAARQIFAGLAEIAPERARQIARDVPADDSTHPLCVPAFVLLGKGGAPIPQEAQRRQALLAVVADPKRDLTDRGAAIDALVPDDQPGRYPDPEIDAGLRRLLDESAPGTHENSIDGFLASMVSHALAARGNAGDFERILAHVSASSSADRVLTALALLLPRRGEEGRRELEAFLRAQLTDKTNLPVDSLIYNAWLAGLRGLRPEIWRLATAGPGELESERAHRYGGDPAALDGERFHVARQVAALWEDDANALVRVKALIAFGTHYNVTGDPERTERFKAELARIAPALSAEDRAAVGAFVEAAVAHSPPTDEAEPVAGGRKKETELARLVRDALGQ